MLQRPNKIHEMVRELTREDDSDSDSDVEMAQSLLDEAELKVAKANQPKARKIARQSKARKKKDKTKAVSRRIVAGGKDDEDISDDQDSEDDEDSSDDEENLRVIDGPLVKLVQEGVACSDANDPAAMKNYSDYGAFSVRFLDEGSKVATLVACAAANHKVTSINGTGTQMIDFARACLDKGSVGTS
jgi:hypothetical protein